MRARFARAAPRGASRDSRGGGAAWPRPRGSGAGHCDSASSIPHLHAMSDVDETPGVLSALLAAGQAKEDAGQTFFGEK